MDKSQSVLKVYLTAICLMHIENGLPDPTLMIHCTYCAEAYAGNRAVRTYEAANNNQSFKNIQISAVFLSNAINWTIFALGSIYAIILWLPQGKCIFYLTWSDIYLHNDYISIIFHQSKTDSFRRGQSIYVCHLYSNMFSESNAWLQQYAAHTATMSACSQFHLCSILILP